MTAPLRGVTTELQSHFGDKGVNKAEPGGADHQAFLFGDKGASRRYAPRVTSPWGIPRSAAAVAGRPGWTVAFLLPPQLLCPWTEPMDARAAVHRAPGHCRHVVAPPLLKAREEARGAYKRSRCTTLERDRNFLTA